MGIWFNPKSESNHERICNMFCFFIEKIDSQSSNYFSTGREVSCDGKTMIRATLSCGVDVGLVYDGVDMQAVKFTGEKANKLYLNKSPQ